MVLKQKPLQGCLITLQPLNQVHIDDYVAMFCLRVRLLLHVSSSDAECAYLFDSIAKQKEGKIIFYTIFDNNNQLIGAIEIRDPNAYPGQLYCWLNEQFWGKGLMQEVITLASHAYFAQTGRLFFTARVDVGNKRSCWALKKAGFADFSKVMGPCGAQYELVLRRK